MNRFPSLSVHVSHIMKTILLRLLPVTVLLLGLNSCVVAPGPGYVGGPPGAAGGGYADDDDGPPEMGYWGPGGEYSAVFLPGYYYGPVFYDAYGHRARYGHYNRHGHEVHSHGSSHNKGSSGHDHDNRSHTFNKGTQGRSTQSSTHTHLQGTGASSFKTAQQGAHGALSKKPAGPVKKKDEHH